MSKKLAAALKVALANEFVAGFITQSAHWNVEGINFQDLHTLFGLIYTDLVADIDVVAEHIRVLDEYAPTSISELLSSTTVQDSIPVNSPKELVKAVLEAVTQTNTAFNAAFKIAEADGDQGIMDYLVGRIDIFAKHLWMLRATSKGD